MVSHELRLLIVVLCHPGPIESQRAIVMTLVDGIDWDRLVTLAARNMVLLHVLRALPLLVEQHILAPRQLELDARKRMVSLAQFEIAALHHRLKQRYLDPLDINHAFIKGMMVANLLYECPADRESRDVDVLVDSADLPRLVEALLCDGYSIINTCWNGEETSAFVRLVNVVEMLAPERIVVELHKFVDMEGVVFNSRRLLRDKVTLAINGRLFSTLAMPSTAMYLMFHHARHGWSSLHWCVDLCRLSRASSESLSVGLTASNVMLATTMAESRNLSADLKQMCTGNGEPFVPRSRFTRSALDAIDDCSGPGEKTVFGDGDPDFPYVWQRSVPFLLRRMIARMRPNLNDYRMLRVSASFWSVLWLVKPFLVIARRLRSGSPK